MVHRLDVHACLVFRDIDVVVFQPEFRLVGGDDHRDVGHVGNVDLHADIASIVDHDVKKELINFFENVHSF